MIGGKYSRGPYYTVAHITSLSPYRPIGQFGAGQLGADNSERTIWSRAIRSGHFGADNSEQTIRSRAIQSRSIRSGIRSGQELSSSIQLLCKQELFSSI